MSQRPRVPLRTARALLCALGAVLAMGCNDGLRRDRAAPDRSSAGPTELRLMGGDPSTLDPVMEPGRNYKVEIFSGLVKLNEKLQVVPDIAERWTVSDGGRSYTFNLRDGVRFHDGKPVGAADVTFSLDRAAAPETGSDLAHTYLGDIVGVRARLGGESTSIAGVVALDERTVRITTDAPKVYFLAKLTYSPAAVVDRETVARGNDWYKTPNGTGPFKLGRWKKDEEMVLERNADFYDGPPKVARVKYFLAGPGLRLYENGEVDVVTVPLDALDRVRDPRDSLHRDLITGTPLSTTFVGFNTRIPPFDDLKVRQAFNHAVDKERLNRAARFLTAQGILPPGMPGYDPSLQGLAYDPVRARQLLAESSYGGAAGLAPLTLSVMGTDTAKAVVEMWKDVLGVDVAIQQAGFKTFWPDLLRHRHQVFIVGWGADYPDPEDFLDVLFHSGSQHNFGQYSNSAVDRLLEGARAEPDVPRRLRTYQEVERMIVADAAWVPLRHFVSHVLVKPYVKNYVLAPQVIPRLKEVEIVGR